MRHTNSPTGEPTSESSTINDAYLAINPRADRMSEARRMFQIARTGSPAPERVSTTSQPRSGRVSPVSASSNSQPTPGIISPVGKASGIPQLQGTASPVSAHRQVQPLQDKIRKVDAPPKAVHHLDQKPATDAYPKISPRPTAPHIASTMNPSPERKPKKQASSEIMPCLEKLAKSHVSRKVESRPRDTTLVDLTSEILPYPERVLTSTPCLTLDMPPRQDSDDSADSPADAQKKRGAKVGIVPTTQSVLANLPSLGISTHSASQKRSGSDKLHSKDLSAASLPQKTSGPEKLITIHRDPKTEFKGNPTMEKLRATNPTSGTMFDHERLCRSSPAPKVNTPLEKFPRTDTDTEKAILAEPPGPPRGFLFLQMSRPREIAFVFLVCILQLIPQAAVAICFPISSTIADSFQIRDPSALPWMVAAYATTFGTFILVSGRLGDIFGHKKLIIVGFIMMTPWSVVAGISHMVSPVLFFVARAMQGVAASLMVPNGLALLGRTYAPGSKMKIIAFSLFGLCAPLGTYLGMLLAPIFAEFVGWPFVFFLLAGMSFLCAIASRFVLVPPPPTPAQMKPFKEKLGDMDWLGAFTGVTGMICVQVAFVSAPGVGWGTSWIYMLLIIGILLVAAFVVVEIKIAEYPLVPFRMLRSDVAFVLATVACGWAVFGIWSWYLWRYLLGIRHYTPLQSAVHVLPMVPIALLASILTAYLMRTTKPAWILLYATFAATLGPLLLYFAEPTQTYWGCTFVSLLVMAIFMDLCLPAATYIMSNFFPLHMQGVSGSLVATVLNYSISLGLGLGTTADTSVGPTPQLSGIRGAWLTGVGIGAFGVLICAIYLFKSILSHHTPARPPTLHDLEVTSMLRLKVEDNRNLPILQPKHTKPPPSLHKRPSIATSLSLTRHPSNATNRQRFSSTGFGFAGSFSLARRSSTSSMESSLFPLRRNSSPRSTSTERPHGWLQVRVQGDRETLTTALPAWRDGMMPQYEWRQVQVGAQREGGQETGPGLGGGGGDRYQQAQRVHVSLQARFLQGRRGR